MKKIFLLFTFILTGFIGKAQINAVNDTVQIIPNQSISPVQFRSSTFSSGGINYRIPYLINPSTGKLDFTPTGKYLRAFYLPVNNPEFKGLLSSINQTPIDSNWSNPLTSVFFASSHDSNEITLQSGIGGAGINLIDSSQSQNNREMSWIFVDGVMTARSHKDNTAKKRDLFTLDTLGNGRFLSNIYQNGNQVETINNKTATASSSTTTYPNWAGITNYVADISRYYLQKDSLGYVSVNSKIGKTTFFYPSANTDNARGIALQNAFSFAQKGDFINVGAGNYKITTILSVKDSQRVVLNSSNIYHTNSAIDIFLVRDVNNVTISGSGQITGSGAPKSVASNADTLLEAGVRVNGYSNNFHIDGLTITGFKGSGIYDNQQWKDTTMYFSGGKVTNCNIIRNNYGFYAVGEYWQVNNNILKFNNSAIFDYGGNTSVNNNTITYNQHGLSIVGGSGNEGHGLVSNNLINHNQQIGIYLKDLRIGMAFSNNVITGNYPDTRVDTTLYMNTTTGVVFNGGEFLAPTRIMLDGTFTGMNIIRNMYFYNTSPGGTHYPLTITGSDANKKFVRFEQNTQNDSLKTFFNVGISTVHGGTGKNNVLPYQLLAGGATNLDSLNQISSGSANGVLVSNGTSALPSFKSVVRLDSVFTKQLGASVLNTGAIGDSVVVHNSTDKKFYLVARSAVTTPVLAASDLTALTSTTAIATSTLGATSTLRIGGYLTVNTISTDVIRVRVSYTDIHSNIITFDLFPQGTTAANISATGSYSFPTIDVRALTGTTAQIFTDLVTSTGAINYDFGGTITKLR
ncbi:MAG TPA: right-handed parallel beta-helix repeat-containing protein [Candidatus Babeliaceae bacterium]|nr:right-handed parallel beta-helix repeat-containing protein [Candidatus Babeliaceae bacterium]